MTSQPSQTISSKPSHIKCVRCAGPCRQLVEYTGEQPLGWIWVTDKQISSAYLQFRSLQCCACAQPGPGTEGCTAAALLAVLLLAGGATALWMILQ